MAVKKNKEIKKAKEELEYLTGDEETKRIAELRDKGIRDYNSGIAYAKEQGIHEGEKKREIQIAKDMLEENLDINLISKVTKLRREEIEKLRE